MISADYKSLGEFFKENEIRIGKGKDFEITPPVYYYSLNDAFCNYFKTFRANKDSYHFLTDFKGWNRQTLAANFGDPEFSVGAILGFHRYFELLLKDLLARINPFLAVKFLEKEEEVVKYLHEDLNVEEVKSIEFADAFKRFNEVIKYYKTKGEHNDTVASFEFIAELQNKETLLELAKWRNRIIHNGKTLPNIYALDFLVSQRVSPLVLRVIESDTHTLKDYKPHYFTTFTGIEIIKEISSVQFDYNDFTMEENQELWYKILHLAHLKEMGRAAYITDPLLKGNLSYYEPYFESPVERFEASAKAQESHPEFFSRIKCPGCGYHTLVVYKKDIEIIYTDDKFISWFTCFACNYSLKNNIGDPYYFGLSDELIFPKK